MICICGPLITVPYLSCWGNCRRGERKQSKKEEIDKKSKRKSRIELGTRNGELYMYISPPPKKNYRTYNRWLSCFVLPHSATLLLYHAAPDFAPQLNSIQTSSTQLNPAAHRTSIDRLDRPTSSQSPQRILSVQVYASATLTHQAIPCHATPRHDCPIPCRIHIVDGEGGQKKRGKRRVGEKHKERESWNTSRRWN